MNERERRSMLIRLDVLSAAVEDAQVRLWDKVAEYHRAGVPADELAQLLGCSRATVYRRLAE